MKTNYQNTVFDITLKENADRLERMSRNRIGWHLRAISTAEKWLLKTFTGIDPTSERVVRIYTYNDEKGQSYDFKCPNYTYDLTSGLYDDFLEAANKVGQHLQEHFGVVGRYFYDVKISLCYYDGKVTHIWKVLKTDNPRCMLGNPHFRKDCYYLNNFNSKLVIEGYHLSGKYKRFVDVLGDLVSKTIIVHSTADAKALLRILKFLGITQVNIGDSYYYNNPDRRAYFCRIAYGYQVKRMYDQTVVSVQHRDEMTTFSEDVIDIDEFIVKRDFKAKLRDMGGVKHGRRKRATHKRAGSNS